MKKHKLFIASLILYTMCIIFAAKVKAQNIGINPTGATPHASAALDIDFTNKGLLIPRIALTGTGDSTTIASSETSLLIYNTATVGSGSTAVTPGYYYWNNTQWNYLLTGNGSSGGWSLKGNTLTDSTINFIGTTDNKPLVFRTNNTTKMILSQKGYLGLNKMSPKFNIDIKGDSGIVFENNTLGYARNGSLDFVSGTALPCYPFVYSLVGSSPVKNFFIYKAKTNSIHIGAFDALHANTMLATNSIAMGVKPEVGENSIALGYEPKATGRGSIALGTYSQALGDGSFSVLSGNAASLNAISIGKSFVSDTGGISLGRNDVFKDYGLALGNYNSVNGRYGVCLGTDLSVMADDAFIIGHGIRPSPCNQFTNRIQNSLMIGFNSDTATLFVGSSAGPGTTGEIGIGTSTPSYKLDVIGTGRFTSTLTVGAYTLPVIDGSNGYVLKTNGAGVLTWSTDSQGSFSGWGLAGNTGTTAGTNFIGTTDAIDLVVKTNNTERIRVSSTGNAGIGVSVAPSKLTTVGTAANPSIPGASSTGIFRVGVTSSEGLDIGKMGAGSYAAWLQSGYNGTTADPLSFQPSGGYVGIGTTAPTEKLTVSGAETTAHGKNAAMGLQNSSAGGGSWYLRAGATGTATPAGGFSIADNSAYRLNIDNVGNVGIITTSPTSTLEINGAVAMKVKTAQAAGTNNPDNTGEIWLYSSGTGTITLPTASTCTNRIYVILNQTGAARTISSYKDLSAAAQTSLANSSSLWVASDGTNWQQIK